MCYSNTALNIIAIRQGCILPRARINNRYSCGLQAETGVRTCRYYMITCL